MDLSKMMAEDSAQSGVRLPSNEELENISQLANEQLRLEAEVEAKEAQLKQLKEQLTKVSEVDIPSAFESIGLTSITLLDKSKVSIKEDVYAGITKENQEKAFAWLEETGNDGIIKNEVKCPFTKGNDSEAKELMLLLTEYGYSYSISLHVHPQTLKAFVRHQLEDGLPIPTDVFSIHIRKVASIELPRTRR